MIDLNIQIKLIIFSFLFGFSFSIILEIFNKNIIHLKYFEQIILSFFIVVFMSFIYFIGIQKIGNGIFHIYSIISIVLGFISYNFILKLIANNKK